MPHTEIPIACTLTATEMPQRLAEMRAIGDRAVLTTDCAGRRAVMRFRRDSATRARLEAIVAAESHCCAFLQMTLTDVDDAVVLTIIGPEGSEPVLAALIE